MIKKVLITSVERDVGNGRYSVSYAYQAFGIIHDIASKFQVDVDIIEYDTDWIKLRLKGAKEKIQKINNVFALQHGKYFIWKNGCI